MIIPFEPDRAFLNSPNTTLEAISIIVKEDLFFLTLYSGGTHISISGFEEKLDTIIDTCQKAKAKIPIDSEMKDLEAVTLRKKIDLATVANRFLEKHNLSDKITYEIENRCMDTYCIVFCEK